MTTTIEPRELKTKLDRGERLQLLDVRSPEEYAAVHIPGAVNVPMDQAAARITEFRSDEPLVLVCHSGTRASLTCETLKARHPEMIVLTGGTVGWKEAGLPVEGRGAIRLPVMRQVQLLIGPLAALGAGMALAGHTAWAWVPLIIGLGLFQAGASGFCPLAFAVARMPWNRA